MPSVSRMRSVRTSLGVVTTFAIVTAGIIVPSASASQGAGGVTATEVRTTTVGLPAAQCQAANPMGLATPVGSDPDSAFTLFTWGDAVFNNSETEGSIAVGGKATFLSPNHPDFSDYLIVQKKAGNGDYKIPSIDGAPTRVLVNQYGANPDPGASRGTAVKVQQSGYVKLGSGIENFSVFPYSSGLRFAMGTAEGGAWRVKHNQGPQIQVTHQPYNAGDQAADFFAKKPFKEYFPADPYLSIMESMASLGDDAWVPVKLSGTGEINIIRTSTNQMPSRLEYGALASQVSGAQNLNKIKYLNPGNKRVGSEPQTDQYRPLIITVRDTDLIDGHLWIPSSPEMGSDAKGAGAQTSLVMYDLSALAGKDVKLVSGSRMTGAIYAPDVNIIVPKKTPRGGENTELEGQIIARTFETYTSGKEMHSNLFYGRFPTGKIDISKEIEGAELIEEGTFKFELSYGSPQQRQTRIVEVAAGEKVTVDCLPLGAEVTIREIDGPQSQNDLVRHDYYFTVDGEVTAGSPLTAEEIAALDNLPVDGACPVAPWTQSNGTQSAGSDDAMKYRGTDGITVKVGPNGEGANASTSVHATNKYRQLGQFSLEKWVLGDYSDKFVDLPVEFLFKVSVGDWSTEVALADLKTWVSPCFPVGADVSIEEIQVPESVVVDVDGEEIRLKWDSVEYVPAGGDRFKVPAPAEGEVKGEPRYRVRAENTYFKEGSTGLALQKIVDDSALLPADQERSSEWNFDFEICVIPANGSDPTCETRSLKDEEVFLSESSEKLSDILVPGAQVTIRELPSSIDDPRIEWDQVSFNALDTSTTPATALATEKIENGIRFTVVDGQHAIQVIATNRLKYETGSVSIKKQTDTSDLGKIRRDLNIPSEFIFDVTYWTSDAQDATQLVIPSAPKSVTVKTGSPEAAEATWIHDIPRGTVVRFVERPQTGLPEDIVHSVEWTDDRDYAIASDSQSPDTNAEVLATNVYNDIAADFSLRKVIPLDHPLTQDHISALGKFYFNVRAFTANADGSHSKVADQTVTIEPGELDASGSLRGQGLIKNVPEGAIVCVEEVQPPESEAAGWVRAEATLNGGDFPTDIVRPADCYGHAFIAAQGDQLYEFEATNHYQAVGSVSLTKAVAGDLSRAQESYTFAVTYQSADGNTVNDLGPAEISLVRQADGTYQTEVIDGLPLGTEVTFTEQMTDDAFLTWNRVANEDGSVSVTVSQAGEVVDAIATNSYGGAFTIEKKVVDESAAAVADGVKFPFSIEYTAPAGSTLPAGLPREVYVVFGGPIYTSPELPAGTTVKISEGAAGSVPGFNWSAVTYALDGQAEQGPVVFTIGQDSDFHFDVVATNTYVEKPKGSLALKKIVTVPDDDVLPTDAEFAFSVKFNGVEQGPVLLSHLGEKQFVDIADGTEVVIQEIKGDPIVGYAPVGVVWNLNGDEQAGNQVSFVMGADERYDFSVEAENKLDQDEVGTFTLEKIVQGIDAGSAEFLFDITIGEGENAVSTREAITTKQGYHSQVLPQGTLVTIKEVQPTIANADWSGVTYTVDGQPWDGEELTFVIDSDDQNQNGVNITATNTFVEHRGHFSITKNVPGLETSQAAFPFEVIIGGVEQPLVYIKAGEPYTSPSLPAGTTVSVREAEVAPIITGYEFLGVSYLRDGIPVDAPVEFMIGRDTTVAITATNNYQLAEGTFSLHKVLAGVSATEFPADTVFPVTATWDGGSKQFELPADGSVVPAGFTLPRGTVVTLTEGELPASPEGHTFISSAASSTTITILEGEIENIGWSVTNTYEATGGFELTKQVSGAEPAEELHTFSVKIGEQTEQTVELLAGETERFGDIPTGTPVIIEEIDPPAIPGVTWSSVSYVLDGTPVQSEGTKIQFSVGEANRVALEATNNYVPEDGKAGFTLKKTVKGVAAAGATFTFNVTIDGETQAVELKDGEVKHFTNLEPGVAVEIREGKVEAIGGSAFKGVSYLLDGKETDSADRAVSFTLKESANIEVSAVNEFEGPEIPKTGGDIAVAGIALVLLMIGAAAYFMARRRRS